MYHVYTSYRVFFPEGTAEGSCEKSTVIKDCHELL